MITPRHKEVKIVEISKTYRLESIQQRSSSFHEAVRVVLNSY